MPKNLNIEISGKVALVTGGSKGIGKATVEKLCEYGCHVYFINRREDDGKKLEHDLVRSGRKVEYFQGDVGNPKNVEDFVESVLRKEKTVDFLVNNAGIFYQKPLEDETIEEFDEIVRTNLRGYFLMAREVIPIMKRNRSGVIINIASMSAYKSEKETVLYSMTKGGILSFSKTLAYELASYGIRVLSISPGNVETPLIEQAIRKEAKMRNVSVDRVSDEYARVAMMHRMAKPEEIASVIAFCLSDLASFMTGSDVLVDGGSVAKSYEL
jgi:NAD(P)-dependent dehydrogenase (short-subunit alcohol dehydrogenase family)